MTPCVCRSRCSGAGMRQVVAHQSPDRPAAGGRRGPRRRHHRAARLRMERPDARRSARLRHGSLSRERILEAIRRARFRFVKDQIGSLQRVFFTSCRLHAKAYSREFLAEKKKKNVPATSDVVGGGRLPAMLSLCRFIRETYGLTDRMLATKEFAVPALVPLVNSVVVYASVEGVVLLMKLRQPNRRETSARRTSTNRCWTRNATSRGIVRRVARSMGPAQFRFSTRPGVDVGSALSRNVRSNR